MDPRRFEALQAVTFVEGLFAAQRSSSCCDPSAPLHPHPYPYPYPYPYPPASSSSSSPPPQPSRPPGVPAGHWPSAPTTPPPPGLVRTTAPYPAPPRVLTNADITLFGEVAALLSTCPAPLLAAASGPLLTDAPQPRPVQLSLTCGICLDRTLALPWPPPSPSFPPTETEPVAVLPCGHFFGATCLARWLDAQQHPQSPSPSPSPSPLSPPHGPAGGSGSCPVCRFALAYPCCGAAVAPRIYDPRAGPPPGQVPATLPEDGVLLPDCRDCVAAVGVERALRRLAELLFPALPAADWRDPSGAEFRHVLGALRAEVRRLAAEAQDLYVRW
ncbi:hypothetical protein F4780DRAFT_794747 [Xylariomycetidae sp. FL0641]|nr:hypothetical protein F4780DRAFT_794747 [Xylariomycetidae sp. FL0641]